MIGRKILSSLLLAAGSGKLPPPKKSRLVAHKNGASTEYEDSDSNTNLETNTDNDINGNLSHKLNTNKLSLSNSSKASNKKLSMNDSKTTPSFKRGPRISDSINRQVYFCQIIYEILYVTIHRHR